MPPGKPLPIGVVAGDIIEDVDARTLQASRLDLWSENIEIQESLIAAQISRDTLIQVTKNGIIWDGHHGAAAAARRGLSITVEIVDFIGSAPSPKGEILNLPIKQGWKP
ncbi:MAG: hypothetical protein K8T91_07270 [Planctomycetes bacterium]|nr:hypothetical protein [Planctomycetota bacterium]